MHTTMMEVRRRRNKTSDHNNKQSQRETVKFEDPNDEDDLLTSKEDEVR